jgi:energy-coupling factor transport system substrate-specific component
MWNYSTLVVLTVLSAGTFAVILIPFKGIRIIPGHTELRPANVIPVAFVLLFGPVGSWGAASGNLIGDFFGTLGVGSFFGFWGNFLAAHLAYKV